MKICQKCKNEITDDFFVGRQVQFPSCGADLHCCLNCSFYQPGSYNDFLESQAERITDKVDPISAITSVLFKHQKPAPMLIQRSKIN